MNTRRHVQGAVATGAAHQGARMTRGIAAAATAAAAVLALADPASACGRAAAGEIGFRGCEPYARAVWMPPEVVGAFGGVRYAFGLARLNRTGLQMTRHDPGEAAVVPVLSLHASPAMGVALMPTLRNGAVGAAVIVSLRLGG